MALKTTSEERGALRPNEAARWLGISRDTFDRLWESGEITTFKIGRARFVSANELERFIAAREATS